MELQHWEHPSGDRTGWGFTHKCSAPASVPCFGIGVGLDAKPGSALPTCDLDCVIPERPAGARTDIVRSYEEIHQLGLLSSNEQGKESDNTRVVFSDSDRLCFQPVPGDSEFGSAGFQELVVVSQKPFDRRARSLRRSSSSRLAGLMEITATLWPAADPPTLAG